MSTRAQVTERITQVMQEVIASSVLTNERIARHVGLNVVDWQTYGVIGRHEGAMTPGQVSAATGLPSSTTTRVLDRLEAKGLVQRDAAPDDRRKVLVTALPVTVVEVGEAYERILDQLEQVHREFTVDQLETVARYLEAVKDVG
ncbi:MarR family transcriptional regulator [Angustibacter peucedani]